MELLITCLWSSIATVITMIANTINIIQERRDMQVRYNALKLRK